MEQCRGAVGGSLKRLGLGVWMMMDGRVVSFGVGKFTEEVEEEEVDEEEVVAGFVTAWGILARFLLRK